MFYVIILVFPVMLVGIRGGTNEGGGWVILIRGNRVDRGNSSDR